MQFREIDREIEEVFIYVCICSDKELFVNLVKPRNSGLTSTIIE